MLYIAALAFLAVIVVGVVAIVGHDDSGYEHDGVRPDYRI